MSPQPKRIRAAGAGCAVRPVSGSGWSELPYGEDSRQKAVGSAEISSCSACGALRAPHPGVFQRDIVLRATLPQPVGSALRLIPSLTPRERATFELLGLGYDNRTIARTLKISERTAKRHVTAILGKLKLQSRLQAGLVALIVSFCSPAEASWPESPMDPTSNIW